MNLYQAAFDHAPLGVAIVGLDGHILRVNEALERCLGYPAEDLTQRTLSEISHPEDLEKDLRERTALEGGHLRSYEVEKRFLTHEGETLWILLTAQSVCLDDQEITHFIYHFQDIHQRKLQELRLAQSEARLRLLADHMRDFVALHSADGEFLYVSPSSQKLLGYTPEELVGRNPYEFFHPEDQERIRREAHEPLDHGSGDVSIRYRMRRKDGSWIWLETLSSPVMVGGVLERIVTASRDVDAQKALEDNLQRTNRELQELVDAVRELESIIPICSHCRKVRNDEDYWEQLEEFLSKHLQTRFSHGICPDCLDTHYGAYLSE